MNISEWLSDGLLEMKELVVDFFTQTLKGAGTFACDIACVGIVVYATIYAFKVITCPAHDKPKFSLIEQGMYLSVAYFISRLMSLLIPCM